MWKNSKYAFVAFVTLISLACGDDAGKKNTESNSADIQVNEIQEQKTFDLKASILNAKEDYVFGEIIDLQIEDLDKNTQISVFLNGEAYDFEKSEDGLIKIKTTFAKMGANSIQLKAEKMDGAKGKQNLFFKVLSDVVSKKMSFKKIKTYAHDRGAYTQGLVFHDGILYEATGLRGESSVRKVDLKTGEVLQSFLIDSRIFGEGITIFDQKIFQLSWTSNKGFVYDLDDFRKITEFMYPTQGWGLTHNGKQLIMSDGTEKLYFIDANSLVVTKQIEVWDTEKPWRMLNELEYFEGALYANVYQTDIILKIDPENGRVLEEIDLHGILPTSKRQQDTDVLNGIAYNEQTKKVYVTGKKWPELYEIQIVEKQ